jgi:hypothetical protein
MRPLFAILGLLLCLIATRADELPVINDSEAIHYIGKNVEMRGFVVSVRTRDRIDRARGRSWVPMKSGGARHAGPHRHLAGFHLLYVPRFSSAVPNGPWANS